MNINSLSPKYSVRKLDENDVDIIYDMSCKNDIFYQYHPPFVTRESILDDMGALPPGKGYDDKFYVGFFENDSLVGLMDLILDYPEKEISFMCFCAKALNTVVRRFWFIWFSMPSNVVSLYTLPVVRLENLLRFSSINLS